MVNFVGITKEKREVVSPFIEKMGGDMTYPVALDGSSRFHKAYSVRSLPAAFVIKDGVIVWAGHPMSEALETQVRKKDRSAECTQLHAYTTSMM